MAKKKVSQLPVADTLSGAELAYVVQSGVSKETTTQEIANLSGSGKLEVIGQRFYTAGSVGNGNTILYSIPVDAGKLTEDGETIEGYYIGQILNVAGARVQLILDNNSNWTTLFDTGDGIFMTSTVAGWRINFKIIKTGTDTAKSFVEFMQTGAFNFISIKYLYSELTGLDFTMPIDFKILGAGNQGVDDVITGEFAKIFKAAAV